MSKRALALLMLAPVLLAPFLLALTAPQAIAQTPPRTETRPMSQTIPMAADPAVAEKLADYDRTHTIEALKDAADAAALHDGEPTADAHARLANWIAILARFSRDLDSDFDPDHPPSMTIIPPGKFGSQYSPGVNPKDVKDPEMRAAYIEAIEKNRILLQNFGTNTKLHEAHEVILEHAANSIADAHQTLGLTNATADTMLATSPISASDRERLRSALK